MKSFLTFSALFLTAGYPCVALAESIGAPVPAFLTANLVVALFSATVMLLLMLGDYSPAARLYSGSTARGYTAASRRESHRLAA
jgi:hypothetical protein